jgi:hypothetical protein
MIIQQTTRHKKRDDCKLNITGVADVSNLQEGFAMMIIFILGFKWEVQERLQKWLWQKQRR